MQGQLKGDDLGNLDMDSNEEGEIIYRVSCQRFLSLCCNECVLYDN